MDRQIQNLPSEKKSKKKKVLILTGDLRQLWNNLSLPIQRSKSTVERKIENVSIKAIHPGKIKSLKQNVTESSVSEEVFDNDTEKISKSEESVLKEQLPRSDEDFGKSSISEKQKTASAVLLVTTEKLR